MTNEKILIISGGSLDLDWARDFIKNSQYDKCIVADKGLIYADMLCIVPDCILGDYDSVDMDVLEKYKAMTQIITYPKEKDYTDTHIALKKALDCNPYCIDIIGAAGTRLDHTLTNISLLKETLERKVRCCMYDKYNKIYLCNKSFSIEKQNQYGNYISFVPYTESVRISISGMKYPLDNYMLERGSSICQSNEITNQVAYINIKDGIIIVFETKD